MIYKCDGFDPADQPRHDGSHINLRVDVPADRLTQPGAMLNLCALPGLSKIKTLHAGSVQDRIPSPIDLSLRSSFGKCDEHGLIRVPLLPPDVGMLRFQLASAKVTGKRNSVQASPSREELLAAAAHLRFFVIVMEQKGGVGKSVGTMVCYETLKIGAEKAIYLIDADHVNRNLSRAGLTKARDALIASRVDFEGFLFEGAERLIAGEVDGVVIDSAAGGETYFRPQLAELARMLRDSDANVRLVIVRPLTISPLVHDNICEFGAHFASHDMGVLLLRNMGQGRTLEDYAEFDGSPEYLSMKKMGMAECILESAGAKYSDLIAGFGKSFADIALNEPENLGLDGRQLEIAKKVFTRPVRLFLARWLLRQTTSFRRGLIESILRTL